MLLELQRFPAFPAKKPRIEVPGLDVDIYGYVTKKLDRTWSRKALNLRYRAQPSLSTASFRAISSVAFLGVRMDSGGSRGAGLASGCFRYLRNRF